MDSRLATHCIVAIETLGQAITSACTSAYANLRKGVYILSFAFLMYSLIWRCYKWMGENDFLMYTLGTTFVYHLAMIMFNAFFVFVDLTGRPQWMLQYRIRRNQKPRAVARFLRPFYTAMQWLGHGLNARITHWIRSFFDGLIRNPYILNFFEFLAPVNTGMQRLGHIGSGYMLVVYAQISSWFRNFLEDTTTNPYVVILLGFLAPVYARINNWFRSLFKGSTRKACYLKVLKRVTFNLFVTTPFYHCLTWHLVYWSGISFSSELPTIATVIVHLVIFFFSWEVSFYCLHSMFHYYPQLYEHIHKTHHEITDPIGIASIYCHPVEHILLNLFPVTLGPILIGAHLSTCWLWYIIVLGSNTISHCGYRLPLLPFPETHSLHHINSNRNFGMLGIMDHINEGL